EPSTGKPLYAVFAARNRISAVAAATTYSRNEPLPETASPAWGVTVVCSYPGGPDTIWLASSTNCTWVRRASATMPTSMVMAMMPSSSSVVAALRLLGFLNAGTPLEMASTPVSAAQPEENARNNRNAMAAPANACSWVMVRSAL